LHDLQAAQLSTPIPSRGKMPASLTAADDDFVRSKALSPSTRSSNTDLSEQAQATKAQHLHRLYA
jgi:hypothetical protein